MRADGDKTKNGAGTLGLPPEEVIFGRSKAMQAVRQRIAKVAGANIPVLIEGEGGTGKELLARWIHAHSEYSAGEFVKLSCAAIPEALLESELFGYEKGAFTGAVASKPGRVELAHKGSLFLDEVADLNFSLQSKLLHFLQDGSFSRIGDNLERTVETRIICASRKRLDEEVTAGRFRADLYYRINVVQLRAPGLSERKEDIPLLAEFFRAQHMKQFGKQCEPLGPAMLEFLREMPWPGNVRELSNGIARYVLIGAENAWPVEMVQRAGQPGEVVDAAEKMFSLKRLRKEIVREAERKLIVKALRENEWNRRRTAMELKISYRSLIHKMRASGIGSRNDNRMVEREDSRGPLD